MNRESDNIPYARIRLASLHGVFDAIVSTDHLGEQARRRGYWPRTTTGDAYEDAFLWAREELKFCGLDWS